MTATLPATTLLVAMEASGSIKYYAGRTALRYDWLTADDVALLRAHALNTSSPWYALLDDSEVIEAARRLGATLLLDRRVGDVGLYRVRFPG